jgi:hypothetical protein
MLQYALRGMTNETKPQLGTTTRILGAAPVLAARLDPRIIPADARAFGELALTHPVVFGAAWMSGFVGSLMGARAIMNVWFNQIRPWVAGTNTQPTDHAFGLETIELVDEVNALRRQKNGAGCYFVGLKPGARRRRMPGSLRLGLRSKPVVDPAYRHFMTLLHNPIYAVTQASIEPLLARFCACGARVAAADQQTARCLGPLRGDRAPAQRVGGVDISGCSSSASVGWTAMPCTNAETHSNVAGSSCSPTDPSLDHRHAAPRAAWAPLVCLIPARPCASSLHAPQRLRKVIDLIPQTPKISCQRSRFAFAIEPACAQIVRSDILLARMLGR